MFLAKTSKKMRSWELTQRFCKKCGKSSNHQKTFLQVKYEEKNLFKEISKTFCNKSATASAPHLRYPPQALGLNWNGVKKIAHCFNLFKLQFSDTIWDVHCCEINQPDCSDVSFVIVC